jgi:hypothetical protein
VLTVALLTVAGSRLATPHVLAAQQVDARLRVEIRQLGSGRPGQGALVTVFDSSGERLAQRLADVTGVVEFTLRKGMLVRVRAEQVGSDSVRSEALRVSSTNEPLQLYLPGRRTHLSGVTVRGRQRCDRATSEGARASAVWNEARKALEASIVSRADSVDRDGPLSMMRYVRQLSLGLRVLREEVIGASANAPAFRSVDAARLARAGWVHDSGVTRLFHAPDATALLSEAFAADHCFRLERRSVGDTALIGLRFDPAQGRTLSDVSGALWLDADTGELRFVEFRYVNIPDSLNHRLAGGRVDFSRLGDGRWIVSRWHIRTPRLTLVSGSRVGDLETPRRTEVIGLQEEGGIARTASRTAARLHATIITGVLHDSSTGSPLEGALVSLEGTAFHDTSDAAGRFTLRPTLPGSYRLLVRHSRLVQLGIGILTDSVVVGAGDARVATLAIPSIASLARQRCPARMLTDARPLWMVGLLSDSATGRPLAGALISAAWYDARVARHGSMVLARGDSAFVESESDAGGHFLLCGLPRDHTLLLSSSGPGHAARLRIPATFDAPGVRASESLLAVRLAAAAREVAPAPAATNLAGVRVEAAAPESGKLSAFERRRWSVVGGRFLDREVLRRRESSRLSDVLSSHLSNVQMHRTSRGVVLSSGRALGSVDPRRPQRCHVQLYLDGIKLFGQAMALAGQSPPDVDRHPVAEIGAIEFYPGAAATPPEFSGRDAECGTLVLWTRER